VTAIDLSGGRDFAGNPVPDLGVELTESAASFNKAGERTDFEPGVNVRLTVGQAALKRDILAAQFSVGDLVKITLDEIAATKSGGTVKVYDVKVSRTQAPHSASAGVPDGGGFSAQPPF
jgi:hypothetical protein